MSDQNQQTCSDPLIICLQIIAKQQNTPCNVETLLEGLVWTGQNIDHGTFMRVAARANFKAQLNKGSLAKLESITLPIILFLKNNQVCVLEKINQISATIIRPEQPNTPETITLEEFKSEYLGQYFQFTPAFKMKEDQEVKGKNRWLWEVLTRQIPTYAEVAIASFLVNLFAMASPLFAMNIYDKVIPNQAYETLWTLSIAVLLVLFFDFILRSLRTYFIDLSSKNVDTWFSSNLFEQLLDIKLAARPQSLGTLMNSMQSFEQIKDFLSSTTILALVDIPFVIIFLALIFFLGGWLVCIPLAVIPLILTVSYLSQRKSTHVINELVSLNSHKQSLLMESLQNIQTVKISRAENVMQGRWDILMTKISELGVRNRFLSSLSVNLAVFAQYTANIAMVMGGVYRITSGSMQMGELIACTILAGRALSPVVQLAGIFSKYKQSMASLNLINRILELPAERANHSNFLELSTLKGDIEFRQVNFGYPNKKEAQLQGVSFSIKAKEHVGIIGLNGSGKSTILKLLLKLYEPTNGTILIDGIDSNQLDPAQLRQHIGFIPQDVALFQGSVRDNVTMGVVGVDDERLLKISDLSGLSRFVKNSSEGFAKDVGERGQAVSGGERQIIGLTRALLNDPSLIIMDEPTNSMDEAGIVLFKENVKNFAKEKTLILVTHKMDLLQMVDRIIVVHQGKIAADGPRSQVLQKMGFAKEPKSESTTHVS